jgi:hypothetical protein
MKETGWGKKNLGSVDHVYEPIFRPRDEGITIFILARYWGNKIPF